MLAQNRTAVIKISCLAMLGNYVIVLVVLCMCKWVYLCPSCNSCPSGC